MNSRRAAVSTLVFVWVFFCILYTLTRPQEYTYDGLCYALDVERVFSNLFHPNHLLYSFAQWLIGSAVHVLGYSGRAIYLMQAVNAMVSAGAVALLGFGLARRLDARTGWTLACLFGVSQAFWVEAADPGCYSFAALAAVGWMLSLQSDRWGSGIRGGVLQAFAVLWHQMLIIAAPASLIRRPRREALCYGICVALIVGGAYAWAGLTYHGSSINTALFWALGPGGPPPGVKIMSTYWWSLDLWVNMKVWVEALSYSLMATDRWPMALRWGIHLSCLALIVFSVRRYWKSRSFAVVVLLSAFQFFFYIGALRYRILMWPFMLILIGQTLVLVRSRWVWGAVWAAVVGVAAVNGTGVIRQRMQPTTNAERTQWVQSRIHSGEFFLFEGTPARSIDNVYLAYFAPAISARSVKGYLFQNPDRNMAPLDQQLNELHRLGRRIVMESSLVKDFPAWRVVSETVGPGGYALSQMTPDFQPR